MATTNASQLAIHIFGGAKGESIVLQLPSGEWGVVDCYASSLKDEASNPTLGFLSGKTNELAFLCLTHPHDDHFRGMSQLLNNFDVRYFWRPAAMMGENLGRIIKAAKMDAAKSGATVAQEDASELFEIFRLVREKKLQSGKPAIPRHSSTGMPLFPANFESADFRIQALAPSTRQIEKYETGLKKCFDTQGRFVSASAPSGHNVISMALLVTFGQTRIVLGGDVESAGWEHVLDEFPPHDLASHAVKVSHHGSTNGYSDELWQTFAQQGPPIAFLTSYRSQRLPRKEALEHIRGFASRVFTPCLPAIHPDEIPLPLSTKGSIASRQALSATLKIAAITDFPVGRCSFVFDNSGRCTQHEFHESAGEIDL